MLFNSWNFLVFFPAVVLIYCVIPKRIKAVWLLVASYYFYMCWNPKYIALILFSTVATYLSGLGIDRINKRYPDQEQKRKRRSKWIIAGCFTANLGVLCLFKYLDFLVQNINAVLKNTGFVLTNPFSFVLPVGISFFTFQALGYIVDVYRGEIAAEKNFVHYALFVSFFPQLVAGPIERSKNLLAEIHDIPRKKMWDYERMTSGLIIMVYGLFLKMVIADRVSILADGIFSDYQQYNALGLWIGAGAFALQIYCDFAGYSTIAIGAARVMGFSLMENFDTPYFARSIREFWRRWHISLSTWFKDYLYIPLGGNRCSRIRRYFNLMVTFLVSGIWHGAGWHFIVWGGLHGLYQIVGDLTKSCREKALRFLKIRTESRFHKLFQTAFTVILVVIAWVFFRMEALPDAFRYIQGMFLVPSLQGSRSFQVFTFGKSEWIVLFAGAAIVFLVGLIKYNLHMNIDEFLKKRSTAVRWLLIYFLIFAIIIFGQYGPEYNPQAFIYFQF